MALFDESEDLDIFTKGEFSTQATAWVGNGNSIELSGIFDRNYQDMFGTFDAPMTEGRKFCLQVQTVEVEGLKNGNRMSIDGSNYQIVSLKPVHDGRMTHIVLRQDFL